MYHDHVEPYAPYDDIPDEIADLAAELLGSLGIAASDQHNKMTPYRLVHYLRYWTRPLALPRFTVFDNVSPVIDQMVVVSKIPFWACCSHHMLPFVGEVDFGYIPDKKLVGLSMVPLFIKEFCARPWLQEIMTSRLADFFDDALHPQGLGLVVRATHTCQMLDLQGPPVPEMIFSEMRGQFRDPGRARIEFLQLVKGG